MQGKLHIVLTNRYSFENLEDFLSHTRDVLAKLPKDREQVVLFSETPFHAGYLPKRREVRDKLRKFIKELKEFHPRTRIAFSINEGVKSALKSNKEAKRREVISNTGYVISSERFLAWPKLEYTPEDQLNTILSKSSVSETRASWNHIKGIKTDNIKIKGRNPFPFFTSNSGHLVEHRVCADHLYSSLKKPSILLVSARYLNVPPYTDKDTRLVIVRDVTVGHSYVLLRSKGVHYHLPLSYFESANPFDKKLEDIGVQIHVVD